jgi:transposase-like protein
MRSQAFRAFVENWAVKDGKAVERLLNGREALLTFSDFPAGHWKHLRTTNVIGSSLEATAKRGSDGLERSHFRSRYYAMMALWRKRSEL